MNGTLARNLIAAALAAASLAPVGAVAQTHPQPQRVLSRGVPDHTAGSRTLPQTVTAARRSGRLVYGRIDAIKANILAVRTRSGRVIRVDGSDAIAAGTYSAPLFVGKLVLLDGYYDAASTLHAQSITREARIDARTAPDR